jgi:hypothetical protein
MKYRLARPEFDPVLKKVIEREVSKQGFLIRKVSPKILQELKESIEVIKKKEFPEHLILKALPDPMGFGIFLHPKSAPLKKGTLIGSYGGKTYVIPQNLPDDSAYAFVPLEDIILLKEEQSVLDPKRAHHGSRKYILCIDAQKDGNFLRFINHSEKPNIQARLVRVKKNSLGLQESPIEVFYFVKKTIKPGQQLLVSYEEGEESYWSVLKIKPEPIEPSTFTLDDKLNLVDHRG